MIMKRIQGPKETYHAEARAGIILKRMAEIFMVTGVDYVGNSNVSFCKKMQAEDEGLWRM